MGRIGASLTGFERQLLDAHARALAAAQINSLRLTSGHNIHAPRDAVSQFMALDQLRADLARTSQAADNVAAAAAVASGAQLALDQIRTQLDTIRELALEDEDQLLTADERAANQAAIDEALAEIDRLVQSDIQGRRLLDGSADYHKSGLSATQVTNLTILAVPSATTQQIAGTINSAATQAVRTYTGAAGAINSGNATLLLTGTRGTVELEITNGESLSAVASRINLQSHRTGVTAQAAGDTLTLSSVEYGSAQTVDVEVTAGAFVTAGTGVGSDATATLNGRTFTAAGNRFTVNDRGLRFTLDVVAGFTGALSTISVQGPALQFSLSSDPGELTRLAIGGLQTARLGGTSGRLDQLASGGSASGLNTNASVAIRIVDEAIEQVTRTAGQVDGFANYVVSSAASLNEGLADNLVDAVAAIDQVNEAEEELLRDRNLTLASNALTALATLGAQNQRLMELLQQVSGFGRF